MFRLILISWVLSGSGQSAPPTPTAIPTGNFATMQECQQATKGAWLQDNRVGITFVCVAAGAAPKTP
jgi:hypothetical protein